MRTKCVHALFPKTRWAVLAATFMQPRRWWFMRELARHLHITPSSLQRELGLLVRAGILDYKREGKHVYFRAAGESPIFAELKGLILKTAGLGDVLRDALEPFGDRIPWAFVYGSVASSKEHSTSDVDLMIIGDVGLAAVSRPLREVERRIGRPVNPTIYTAGDFASKLKSRHHFISTVMHSKRVFVLGNPREFGRTFGR